MGFHDRPTQRAPNKKAENTNLYNLPIPTKFEQKSAHVT
jgi:hypothetical protein